MKHDLTNKFKHFLSFSQYSLVKRT